MDVGARTAKEVTRVSHGMAKTELRLFTGSAHPLLAQEIAEFLCVPMGQARLHRFADTEVSFQIDENIRGMDVFIGSNTNLVAPLRVGRGAIIAAGSTVTHDVKAESLALARARQVAKPGWAKTFRSLKKKVNHA